MSSEQMNLSLELSDDEAPEEMSFESARNEALSRVMSALETDRREKEQLKEKRRRRQELFQQQKKRRLLSADVLDQVDAAAPKQQKSTQNKDPEESEEKKLPSSRSLKDVYTVTTVKQKVSFQQQAAQDFFHSRLYGPQSGRTTNNELLSLHNKKGPCKKAAVQFTRKDWAPKQKAKAEKLKQRWIHKQQQHA